MTSNFTLMLKNMIISLILVLLMCSSSFGFISSNRFTRSLGLNHRKLDFSMVNQIDINMPALSSTMKEGKIVAWNKKIGDKINSGDVLLVVESDKADMDVEAFEEGYLAAIYTPEGGTALVGAPVAVLVENKDDIGKVGTSGTPTPKDATPAVTPVVINSAVDAPEFESIMMPALSSTMKEGKIVAWSKKIGDKISSGDMLLVVESDKADMDVESFEEGFLATIVVKDGEIATVGAPVGYLAKTSGDIPAVQAYLAGGGASSSSATAAAQVTSAAPAATASTTSATATISAPPAIVNSGRVSASGYAQQVAKQEGIDLKTVTPSRPDQYIIAKDLAGAPVSSVEHVPAPGTINASPMARKLATENNLDVNKIKGTGNFGRVMPDDVLKAAGKYVAPVIAAPIAPAASATKAAVPATKSASNTAAAAVLDGVVAMDGMQKAVAKNMEKTLSVPIFRVSREIVTDKFDELYAQLKPKGVTVSAMLAKAVAEVLKKHPVVNAAYVEGGIKYHKDINVAMAVAIDGGLITPTIIKAQDMDLFSIGRVWKELVEKAKTKKLTPAEYSSGTFTISNLGMFGVHQFDAILPPNTGSILAIAASTPKVVQLKNGHFGVQKSMIVTITCDHRHIYGADAAEFLKDLADLLENNVQSLTMG